MLKRFLVYHSKERISAKEVSGNVWLIFTESFKSEDLALKVTQNHDKVIWFFNRVDNANWPPSRVSKIYFSSVGVSSEPIVGFVWFLYREIELRYWL